MPKIIFALCVLVGLGSGIALFPFQDQSENVTHDSADKNTQNTMTPGNKPVAAHSTIKSVQKDKQKNRSRDSQAFPETDLEMSSDPLPAAEIDEQIVQLSNSGEMEPVDDPEADLSDESDRAEYDLVEHEEPIQMDTEMLARLEVGQAVDFYVPQLGHSFETEIESESEQLEGVKVWTGKIEGKQEDGSDVIITRGESMTNVILSTSKGVYTAHIDNKTGEGEIVDDREYTDRMIDEDDGIPFNPEPELE